MRSIQESYGLIIKKISELDYHLLKILRVPADVKAIKAAENELGFAFNDELIRLYSCADGTNIDNQTPSGLLGLIPIHVFMSLKESISYYKTGIAFEDSFLNWDTGKKPGKKLFPFLEDGAGNCYWVDLNIGTETYGQIFWTNTFGENPDYTFFSLTTMFHVISECYDTNVFFINADGYLDCDYVLFDKISKDYNKQLTYWKNK